MESETSEQLQDRLAATNQRIEQEKARTAQLINDVDEAGHRQRLREQIRFKEGQLQIQQRCNLYHADFRRRVDEDVVHRLLHERDHPPASDATSKVNVQDPCVKGSKGEVIDCGFDVVKTEFEWRIAGLSWLENTLAQEGRDAVDSDSFFLNDKQFDLFYNPAGGIVGDAEGDVIPRGSLVLRHFDGEDGITLRYRFFVRDPNGEFQPWGELTNECHPHDESNVKIFGPDLQWVKKSVAPRKPLGIFGLSHKDLLKSKWVQDDTLIVKVHIQMRPPSEIDDIKEPIANMENRIKVPEVTLQQDLLSLYTRGEHCDVTFVVGGERIQAHAAILCVRSEVFDKELGCGMRESTRKEIQIPDIDVDTFKVFLKFLYTDDLTCVEEEVNTLGKDEASDSASKSSTDKPQARTPVAEKPLLRLLSLSHMYQVTRLQLWCENQLCKSVTVPDVCSILCQAHLYQATLLEKHCLSLAKANMAQVVATQGFTDMAKRWPEVMVKVNLCFAGVSGSLASTVIETGFGQKRSMSEKSDEPRSSKRRRSEQE
mmetsp:Transcript_93653/g.171654  ORF Transcript_93653/g.171654 Transcript_93653/m.171654 type:complete len:541 (-) Transcript_93653:33-1655(-)